MNIADRVRKILVEDFDAPRDVQPDACLAAAPLSFDSLDHVEFVMELEEAFDLEITDDQAERIKTVRDAIRVVEERVAEGVV